MVVEARTDASASQDVLTTSSLASLEALDTEGFLFWTGAVFLLSVAFDVEGFATGHDSPRNFPRLAMPTPHVKVVLYPEQSLPVSRHWLQYGRRRSHGVWRLRHVKQSSAAPVAAALLLLFLGAAEASCSGSFPGAFVARSVVVMSMLTGGAMYGGQTESRKNNAHL